MFNNGFRFITIVGSRTKNKDDHIRCGRIVGHAFRCLDNKYDVIISGGCPTGADFWAKRFANKGMFRYLEAVAFWNDSEGKLDKSAGLYRNQTMAMISDIALVVWDGKSTGTEKAIRFFDRYEVPYWTVQL